MVRETAGGQYRDERDKLSGEYLRRLVKGRIGQNLPEEAAEACAQAVVDVSKSWPLYLHQEQIT
jgi:hypothetical protein